MSYNENWLRRLRDANAVWEYQAGGPHAAYEMATLHSDFYFNSDVVVSDPVLVQAIGMNFAQRCAERNIRPDWVASYSAKVASGLVLAAKMAELLAARFGYVDLQENICRFSPLSGQSALLITDDIHSGQSLEKMIRLVENAGGNVAPAILTLGNFYGAAQFHSHEIVSLFNREVANWNADDCPLCRQGSPATPARRNWRDLTESVIS